MQTKIVWEVSKKNNHFTRYGGVTTTIFKNKYGSGYKVSIVGPGGEPIYLPSNFTTVKQAKEAVEELLFATPPPDDRYCDPEDEPADAQIAEEQAKIQEKIASLMRLAERPGTPAEGQVARQMAMRLAQKYSLDWMS